MGETKTEIERLKDLYNKQQERILTIEGRVKTLEDKEELSSKDMLDLKASRDDLIELKTDVKYILKRLDTTRSTSLTIAIAVLSPILAAILTILVQSWLQSKKDQQQMQQQLQQVKPSVTYYIGGHRDSRQITKSYNLLSNA